jgi:hypothetical protein
MRARFMFVTSVALALSFLKSLAITAVTILSPSETNYQGTKVNYERSQHKESACSLIVNVTSNGGFILWVDLVIPEMIMQHEQVIG